MKKIVKKIGTSFVFILDREDRHIYNLEEGDIIDLGDMVNTSSSIRQKTMEILENAK